MRNNPNLLREFSVPLVVGVLVALIGANLNPEQYHAFLHVPVDAGLSLHFLTKNLFMTLFFAITAVEITQSCRPGGDLHPLKQAVNPLLDLTPPADHLRVRPFQTSPLPEGEGQGGGTLPEPSRWLP